MNGYCGSKADVWSAGIALFTLATGAALFACTCCLLQLNCKILNSNPALPFCTGRTSQNFSSCESMSHVKNQDMCRAEAVPLQATGQRSNDYAACCVPGACGPNVQHAQGQWGIRTSRRPPEAHASHRSKCTVQHVPGAATLPLVDTTYTNL